MSQRICRICSIGPDIHSARLCEDLHRCIELAIRFDGDPPSHLANWPFTGGWSEVPRAPGVEDAFRKLKIPFFKRDDAGDARGARTVVARRWVALMTRPWIAELFHEAMMGESRPLEPFMHHLVHELLPVWATHHQDPVIAWWRENWPLGSVFTARF